MEESKIDAKCRNQRKLGGPKCKIERTRSRMVSTSPPVPSSGSVSCTSNLIRVDLPGLGGEIGRGKEVIRKR